MSDITVDDLDKKYGGLRPAIRAYVRGDMRDPDEIEAVNSKVNPHTVLDVKMDIVLKKLDLIMLHGI